MTPIISIGIDPGAKYTGVSVINNLTDEILLSSTYVKPDDTELFDWGYQLGELIQNDVITLFPEHLIGIEGVSAPKGYNNGRKSPINPKYLMFAAVIAGMLARKFAPISIIPPGRNGSSRSGYPAELNGRRPATLPGNGKGAGTRNHEKSAYDVAKSVLFMRNQTNPIGTTTNEK